MDKFGLFFAFYSLILGLAITEVLGGFAQFVRSHTLQKLGAQTALLALYVFVAIAATWIDAFTALRSIDLNVESLWAPILTSTSFYLAAVLVFPSRQADLDNLDAYFSRHKRLVVGLLLAAELLVNFTFLPLIEQGYREHRPSLFLYFLPFHIVQKTAYAGAFIARSKRWNIIWLLLLSVLLVLGEWDNSALFQMLDRAYGPRLF